MFRGKAWTLHLSQKVWSLPAYMALKNAFVSVRFTNYHVIIIFYLQIKKVVGGYKKETLQSSCKSALSLNFANKNIAKKSCMKTSNILQNRTRKKFRPECFNSFSRINSISVYLWGVTFTLFASRSTASFALFFIALNCWSIPKNQIYWLMIIQPFLYKNTCYFIYIHWGIKENDKVKISFKM